jgi:hypothetical protein
VALDLVKAELHQAEDTHSVEIIDSILSGLHDVDAKRSVAERFFNATLGPRPFLEDMYYKGLDSGVHKVGSQTVNFLKVAQNILETR